MYAHGHDRDDHHGGPDDAAAAMVVTMMKWMEIEDEIGMVKRWQWQQQQQERETVAVAMSHDESDGQKRLMKLMVVKSVSMVTIETRLAQREVKQWIPVLEMELELVQMSGW